ncbi:unnamed protein product [Adineta ricciae]|uniref:Uncharacterized protein n=1 Tax=Adineta ricciae TaxID=249248 RepID=A0A815X4I4_ADIRI|nr:unnamed protein product [Adineta ricciae]
MAGNNNHMQGYINKMIANNTEQHGVPSDENRYHIVPMRVTDVDDAHGSTGALYLIGFWNGQAIYRTTHTVAHHMEGNQLGQYEIHWPPVFPDVWVPECEVLQIDISIRDWFASVISLPTDDNDDDLDEIEEQDEYVEYDDGDEEEQEQEEYEGDDDRYRVYGYEDDEDNDIDEQFYLIDLLEEQEEI